MLKKFSTVEQIILHFKHTEPKTGEGETEVQHETRSGDEFPLDIDWSFTDLAEREIDLI